MNAIVVVDKNWGIGKDGGLLVHLPGDLKYFREKTLGKVLVMGRRTLESLPGGKPLPGRTTIVMTKKEDYCPAFLSDEIQSGDSGATFHIVHSMDELGELLGEMQTQGLDLDEDVFVAGGEQIYAQMNPYCHRFYVTRMEEEFDAEKHFINMDKLVKNKRAGVTWESGIREENGIRYRFMVYERLQK